MVTKLVFLAFASLQLELISTEGECPDINGRSISQGLHYVPGPNKCALCICENGQPKWCKAVLCSTPQDCKTFRLGNTCCEFICLDDTLVKHPEVFDAHHDFGLRLIAGAITVILFLSILSFMVHRLRQRKLRGRQNRQQCEDERSLASIGYVGSSMSYMGNNCYDVPENYPLWKPPGSYFPRGEAPPPYEEAVAQSRNDSNRQHSNNASSLHSSLLGNHTTNIESMLRNGTSNSGCGNQSSLHSSDARCSQVCRNSGDSLLHPSSIACNHAQVSFSERERSVGNSSADVLPSIRTQHIVSTGNPKLGSVKITSSISLTGARALLNAVTRNIENREASTKVQSDSDFYIRSNASASHAGESTTNLLNENYPSHSILCSTSRHRTIPLNQTTTDNNILIENLHLRKHESSNFHQSVNHHKLSEQVLQVAKEIINKGNVQKPSNISSNIQKDRSNTNSSKDSKLSRHSYSKSTELIQRKETDPPKKISTKSFSKLSDSTIGDIASIKNQPLPVDTDKPSCGCSYDCQPPTLTGDEQEDYYSECENCKSGGSSYYVEWSPCETMTLQRRGRGSRGFGSSSNTTSNAPPRAGATLPTNSHANDRLLDSRSENRESWFSAIPGSSSSEED